MPCHIAASQHAHLASLIHDVFNFCVRFISLLVILIVVAVCECACVVAHKVIKRLIGGCRSSVLLLLLLSLLQDDANINTFLRGVDAHTDR